MKEKRATLRDVAKEAGVSYQTVSRVINSHENVSEKTRSRVMKAIDKLDFRVNRVAQIMQTKRSQTIETILFYAGFNLFLYEMAHITQQHGYHFMISAIYEEEIANAIDSAASRFVDGLILNSMSTISEDYETLNKLCNGIPFVMIGARLGSQVPSVSYDQRRGAQLAVQHLMGLGHTQIAEISGILASNDGYDRHAGWKTTLLENDLPLGPSVEGDFSIDGGYAAMNQLLEGGAPFSAVFIGNDSMTFGAHTALREHGLRVPEDISIVSFDDIPEAAHFTPGLTTVRQDFHLLGRMAVEYLLSRINNPDTPIHQRILQPELIVRDSTQAYQPR
ncbi:LacI family DNA-binding transcriptional regulator [Phototrophicus methaneseepsis]|uniref:LacI family DNA-binding transcriptional regulator n=1 Tax=Phototrophicus methaneseepsis TaxID=2710758 RepID=A0A7S8IFF7_9CHLR|nr:LacI family DNA-binding transcriptional regulator [Phototrophicus methaneseepsis]QPC83444.1 LacI family DNA-binding transcriptional regulator [Phototrophicus methaneseepsis]